MPAEPAMAEVSAVISEERPEDEIQGVENTNVPVEAIKVKSEVAIISLKNDAPTLTACSFDKSKYKAALHLKCHTDSNYMERGKM